MGNAPRFVIVSLLTGVVLLATSENAKLQQPRGVVSVSAGYAANIDELRHWDATIADAADGGLVHAEDAFDSQSAIGTGVGFLGDRKKMAATSAGGRFEAPDQLRSGEIVTLDMRGARLGPESFVDSDGRTHVCEDTELPISTSEGPQMLPAACIDGRFVLASSQGGGVNEAYSDIYLAIESGTNLGTGLSVDGVGSANRAQVEEIFFRALTDPIPTATSFPQTADAIRQSAADLAPGGEAQRAIEDALIAVGPAPATTR